MTSAHDPLYLGFVEKAHGLRGEFVARVFAVRGEPGFPRGIRLRLAGFGDVTVAGSRPAEGGCIRVSVGEIGTRTVAEELRGREILVERSSAGELGFVPLHAYVGVELRSGGRSFRVTDVDPIPGNPLLIVEGADGRRFPIPLAMVPEGPLDGPAPEVVLPAGLEDL